MALKEPASMDELIYFTRRSHPKGIVTAWARKQACPKCKKAMMGKPRGPDGNVKIRAKEYTCPACEYTAEKVAYENTLTAEIIYACPHCGAKGEHSMPFQRKKAKIFDEEEQKQITAEVLRFPCAKCKQNIDITKKMK